MVMHKTFILLLFLYSSLIHSLTYYVDSVNGNDNNNGLSINLSKKTFNSTKDIMVPGDTAYFCNGYYGDIKMGIDEDDSMKMEFDDWVDFRVMEGHEARFGKVEMGRYSASFNDENGDGMAKIYSRFRGFVFEGGFSFLGSNHLEIYDSVLSLPPPYIGADYIGRGAFSCRHSNHIKLINNEVTNTASGLGFAQHCRDIEIIGNHIHNISHDGISICGASNVLVENNIIHNLDDNCDDDDLCADYSSNPESWNKHCDGMHFYPVFDTGPFSHNVIVRGNKIYHLESMGVMMNTKHSGDPEIMQYENIIFENNIFGQGRGPSIHAQTIWVRGFTVRYNSFISFENDGFYSRYRWVDSYSVGMMFPSSYSNAQGYDQEIIGNIFFNAPSGNIEYQDVREHNIMYGGETYRNVGETDLWMRNENPFSNMLFTKGGCHFNHLTPLLY